LYLVNAPEPTPTGPVGPELLAWLLDRHGPALVLFARQWCRAADDAVQEALVELARQVQAPRDLLPWLYRVVRNKALSVSRAEQRRRRHETRSSEERPTWFVPACDAALDGQAATEALAALDDEQRQIVVAHLWGGLTFAEIGRLIDTSDSTAHRRYVAALAVLRERLGSVCPPKTP
jgi:RNA polymerase sigma-70 factor (ECF subfamily)